MQSWHTLPILVEMAKSSGDTSSWTYTVSPKKKVANIRGNSFIRVVSRLSHDASE